MQSKKFILLLASFLLVVGNLLAQPPCTEYPSPVIQPSYQALCQEPPKEDPHGGQSDRKEECLLVCENTPVTYETPATGNTITWEAFGDVSPTTGSGPSFSVTWNSPGGGLVQVTETTPDGCSTTVNVCVKVVDSPDADFTSLPPEVGGTINICEGGEVHFQDQSSNDVITWVWDFGDGAQSNDQNPSHQYNTAGTYTATLTVYNDCGCSDTKDVKIVVDPTSAPIIACISTVCENDQETYSVTNGCPGATYTWSTDDGTGNMTGVITGQSGNQVTVVWNNPSAGQGFLTVQVNGCGAVCPIPATVIVPILTNNLALTGPDVVCVGDLVEYAVPPQPSNLFTWYSTASPFFASTPNDHSIDVYWTVPGTYEICVRISATEFNCVDYDQYCMDVTVKNPFSVSPEFAEICETDSYTFFAPVSSDWEAIDALGGTTNLASSATSATVNPMQLAPGFYEIRATDVSGSGLYCNTEASGYLTVVASAPTLASGALMGNMTVCPGSSHDYTATPDNGYYLQWDAGVGNTVYGTGNAVSITWGAAPPYTINITQVPMAGPACPSTTSFPISVLTPTVPTLSGPTTVCVDGTATYSASPTTDVTFMEWEVIGAGFGSVVTGQNTPTVDVKFNNAPGTNIIIRFHYTICNIAYFEDLLVDVVAYPGINLTIPADACQNEIGGTPMSASLTFVPAGSTINWDWDFGTTGTDTDVGDPSNVTYSFPNHGTEVITVVATITGGACPTTVTATQLINVKPAPLVNITATNGNSICPPTNMTTLTASVQNAPGGPGNYTYEWAGGPTSPSYSVSTPGTYTLTVTDNNTLCETVETYTVFPCSTVPPCSGVTFGFNQTDCNSFDFNGSLVGWTNPTWNFGDGNGATGLNVSHTYDHSGYYTVTLTGYNGANSCSEVMQVIVYFVPDFIAEFTCNNVPAPASIDVQLIDQTDKIPGTTLSYFWTYPGGTSTAQNPFVGGMPSGNVNLQVTDGSTTCDIDWVINVPSPTVASFTANDPVCEGQAVTFINTSTPSVANIVSATWTFGDGSASNLIPTTERTYTYPLTGPLVNLEVTDIYGCISNTGNTPITVHENILKGNVSIAPVSNPSCPSPPVNLTANFPGATLTPAFQWNSTDLIYNLGTTNPSGAVPATGDYFVEITDGNGCVERSASTTVIIVPEPVAYILGQEEICVDEILTWNANQGSDYSYSWSVNTPGGGPFTYTSTQVSFAASLPGTYTAQVTLTDNNTGCSNTSAVFTTTVHDGPQGLTINTTPPSCAPANLSATVASPALVDYVWSTGDVGPTTVALGGGTVEVTAYTDKGCSASETITVGEGPDIADVAVGCYCFPEEVTWTAPQGFGYTYAWYMVSTPTDVFMGSGFQLNIASSGIYYVEVIGPDGCVSTSDYIHIEIGDCGCEFEVDKLDLECAGVDPVTGGYIYNFTTTIVNHLGPLAGLSATSPDGVVTSLSPTSLPGGGTSTTVTGTFVLYPGNTTATITFQAAGADGLLCDYKLFVPKFPDCGGKECDVEWSDPTIKCIFNHDGFSYYDFSIAATNFGNTLNNIVWYPCSSPDVTITSSFNVLNSNTSTLLQGMIKVRDGITSDCFKICGYDVQTREECCWELEFTFPECKEEQKPCDDMHDLGSKLLCANPTVDPAGNLVYDFDINVSSHLFNASAYLIPIYGQGENHVTNLNVIPSGYTYQLTGTVVDVPSFNDPLCFWVITYDGQEVCWMKFCLELPKCKSSSRTGNEQGENRNATGFRSMDVSPNPSASFLNVTYEVAGQDQVELKMIAIDGQVVRAMGNLNPVDQIRMDLTDVADGMYLVAIFRDGQLLEQQRVVVSKGH